MKKLIFGILAAMAMFGFLGCSNPGNGSSGNSTINGVLMTTSDYTLFIQKLNDNFYEIDVHYDGLNAYIKGNPENIHVPIFYNDYECYKKIENKDLYRKLDNGNFVYGISEEDGYSSAGTGTYYKRFNFCDSLNPQESELTATANPAGYLVFEDSDGFKLCQIGCSPLSVTIENRSIDKEKGNIYDSETDTESDEEYYAKTVLNGQTYYFIDQFGHNN